MFKHTHPYSAYIPENTKKLIVGTLPPPRFTTRTLKDKDVDFCYGSKDGLLWPILEKIYNTPLLYENSQEAITQRKQLLQQHQLGICDIVEYAYRDKIDASDLGMKNLKLRDVIEYVKKHQSITTLLFMGGNSKNGPEYLFRKLVKKHGLPFVEVTNTLPRIHKLTIGKREIKTVSLIAPSGSANRAIGSMLLYKQKKAINPEYNTFLFRVEQYRPYFLG